MQKTDNELIAEFMGLKSYEDSRYGTRWPDPTSENRSGWDLKYHSSWDWMMPVVTKIGSYRPQYPVEVHWITGCTVTVELRELHTRVVEFIKLLNQQP